MLKDLEKAPDMAYHDILNNFDLTWGIKGLIMTRSNLVVTWKDRVHRNIISWLPLGSRCFSRVGRILGSFCNWICNWIFNLCQKKKTKKLTWMGPIWSISTMSYFQTNYLDAFFAISWWSIQKDKPKVKVWGPKHILLKTFSMKTIICCRMNQRCNS